MYSDINFKTKKALKEAVNKYNDGTGTPVTIHAPGLGTPKYDGVEFLEGPWYPEPHRWYAQVEMHQGVVVKVIK